jgi:hypothetical protein
MKKILYILFEYPQLSETYIQVEIDALKDNYDIRIVSLRKADCPAYTTVPYVVLNNVEEIISFAKSFEPDYIHTHWIDSHLKPLYEVAKAINTPFTIRSHSFDVLKKQKPWYKKIRLFFKKPPLTKIVNSPLCLGVLAFPFAIKNLKREGIKTKKIISTYPVIDYQRFYDKSPNGEGIINLGASLPKHNFEAYLHFAKQLPSVQFHLYPIGYGKKKIQQENEKLGYPVNIHDEVPHDQMPKVYKQYQWLVYTANPDIATVGWPLAAAEAMASGVGVCVPNMRPDIYEYVEDAAIVYNSLEELKEIICKPVPEEMRERGFEVSKKCDIQRNLHLLTNLWK